MQNKSYLSALWDISYPLVNVSWGINCTLTLFNGVWQKIVAINNMLSELGPDATALLCFVLNFKRPKLNLFLVRNSVTSLMCSNNLQIHTHLLNFIPENYLCMWTQWSLRGEDEFDIVLCRFLLPKYHGPQKVVLL